MSRRGWKADVFEARVNNASSSQGVRWKSGRLIRPRRSGQARRTNFAMGSGKAFHRKACSSNVQGQKTARPPARGCGSGLWTDRSRTGAQAWRQTIAPSAHPGPRLWSGSEVPALCRNGAGREAGERDQRHPPARRHRDRGWGGGAERRRGRGGAWRDPNKPTCGPDRRGDVTARWRVGALARARRRPYPCRGP